jgi:hypothetical protein
MNLIFAGLLCLLALGVSGGPSPVLAQASGCRTVAEAVDAGEAALVLTANNDSFYASPLDYRLTNLTDRTLDLCFPAGLTMTSGNGAYQNLILTRTVKVTLPPDGEKRGDLSADCMNLSKDSPRSGADFSVGAMAQGDLLRVAQAIDTRSAQGRLGSQLAIWAVTDGLTLEDFNGGSGSDTAQMLQVVAPLLCLAGDEIELGETILKDAGADASLFAPGSGGAKDFCANRGLPANFDEIVDWTARLGGIALAGICGGCCLGIIILAALIAGIIALVRSRRK